jgi:large repetitive protein
VFRTIEKYKKWISILLTTVMLFTLLTPYSVIADTQQPVTLAKWDFTSTELAEKLKANSGVEANIGSLLSASGAVLATTAVAGPSGSTVPNANNWTNSESHWKLSLSTANFQNITLSSKQFGSNTGPKDFKLQYSLDNATWVDIPNGAITVANAWTTGVVTDLLLPAEANNNEIVHVRWLKSSETSIGGGTVASTGTNRIADIEFKGDPLGSTPISDPVTPPPTVEKTATPDSTKITYSSYDKVTGAAGAVVSGGLVNVYYDNNNTVVASATAASDGSFNVNVANAQQKTAVQVAVLETGKSLSDKVSITYSGTIPTPPPPTNEIKPGDVVFSQIYPNGGNSGAFYRTKFFELYNNTDQDIDLSNWSIAYSAAATMNFGSGQALSGVIKAHSYFLVAGNSGATGQPLPVTPDVTVSLNPSGGTGGALVLAKKRTAVVNAQDPDAIDLLAYSNGSSSFKNQLYWGEPIVAQNIGSGTMLRKTNIGSDPRSAYGLGNGWFTKDPSLDFVINTLSGTNVVEEMVVRNSKYMVSPNISKISFTKGEAATIVGEADAVPALATVKAYVENGGALSSVGQVTATATGSFTINLSDASINTVYLTHTDAQPGIESFYSRIDAVGTKPRAVEIGELHKNGTKGTPINFGYSTTIEGVATTTNTPDGNVKTNFTIQDLTGGIQVINNLGPFTSIQAGNKYSIDGRVVFTAGLTQFIPTAIRDLGVDQLPKAELITIASLANHTTAEAYESKLVSFKGKVTNIPADGPNYDLTVSDAEGNLVIVRVMGSLGGIERDANYTFTGILGQYRKAPPFTSGYYLVPRTLADIKGQLVLQHTPLEKAYTGVDVTFRAVARNVDSLTLYFKGTNDSGYQTSNFTSTDGRNYTGKIPLAYVPEGKFFYYVEAVSGDDKELVGSAATPIEVEVVEDNDGPLFYNALPIQGEYIESRTPIISVNLDDANGVDLTSVTMTIDGIDFSSKLEKSETELKLRLSRAEQLTEGLHTVVVTAKDNLGNASTFTWNFTVAKRFTGGNHYYGTTHNHTNISHDATGTPEDSLKAALRYNYDWYVFSDHSHDIDPEIRNTEADTVERFGMKERAGGTEWDLTKALSEQYTKDGKFIVFPGFEMTSTTWGHANVIGTENFIDRVASGGAYQQLQNFYNWTLTYDNLVAQFNHPDMTQNAFNNFIPYNKNVDKLFTMIEVGNGSGKYSYFNSEKKWFSALDLGWHIAPTYGEDNHDATWGQTKRRTVIVAEDLTQEALMDSMRKMRVYMTEDPNFKLDFTASGFYMGAVTDTDTLEFTVTGSDDVWETASDPDYHYLKTASDDTITKVELITNGGRVIDTYVPQAGSTSVDWAPTVTVAGGQQWFIVKITQKDGDRVYSSPIWSQSKDLSVNVSNVSVAEGALIGGVPSTLIAGISNQGVINVSKLTAKFYYDSVASSNLIGEAYIDALPANASTTASVTWQNPVPGKQNIIVVLSTDDGNDLGPNKFEQEFNVQEPLNKVVMIDGSKNNENTKQDSGTYRDNLKAFTLLLKQQGYTVVENNAALTDNLLNDVHVLMITRPTTAYTTAEIEAVNRFVANGGSILLTQKSNHGASNQTLNSLLEGIGSTILVNNDGVFDESNDGNFWSGNKIQYNYAVKLHPKPVKNGLTDFVPTIEYFSGSSLAKNDGAGGRAALTDSDTVNLLVRGNETTFQNSPSVRADTVPYNVHTSQGTSGTPLTGVTGGSVIPLVASEQIGKGRIIVSGMNIYNDSQMNQSFSPRGNPKFAVNAVNWLAGLEKKIVTVAEARKMAEYTQTVVEGVVTTGAGVFFDAFYLQDATGGIMAFNEVPEGSLKPGDVVRVYGFIKDFENNIEIIFNEFATDVIKLGEVEPLQPTVVSTGLVFNDEHQGLLVKVKGAVKKIIDETSFIIDDGSGEALVFVDGYIVNQSGPIPDFKLGDIFEAVGISGKYGEGDRIRVRDTKELSVAPAITVVINEDNSVTATISDFAINTIEQKGTVEFDLINHAGASLISVELTSDQVAALKSKESNISIPVGDVSLNIPATVLTNGNEKTEIIVKRLEDNEKALSAVYDFTILQGNVYISPFAEGILLAFTVDQDKVTDPNLVKIFYLNEDENKWELIGGDYNNGTVTALTSHFSTFAVFEMTNVDGDPGDGTTDPGDGTTDPGDGTTDPGDGTTDPGDGTTDPGDGTTDPGDGTTDPGDGTTDPGDGTTDPGDGTTDPGDGTTDPGDGTTDPGDGTTDPGDGTTDPGDGTTDPGDGTTDPGNGTTDPGDGTTDPGNGTTDPGDGTTNPGDGTTDPGDGTTDPSPKDKDKKDKDKKDKQDKAKDKKKDGKLPATATTMYNWLFVGMSLLCIGLVAFIARRNRRFE